MMHFRDLLLCVFSLQYMLRFRLSRSLSAGLLGLYIFYCLRTRITCYLSCAVSCCSKELQGFMLIKFH